MYNIYIYIYEYMNVNSEMLFMSIHGGHKIVQNPKRAMNTKKAKTC